MQQLAVHQYNAQGRARRGVGLLGSFQSMHQGFEWHSSGCRSPGSAKNADPGAGALLVANDGGRLQGPGIRGCPRCRAFEGAIPKTQLYPIRAHTPLELVHVDFTSMESTMELNKPPSVKNILVIMDHFMCYALAVVTIDQMAKTVAKVLYERFIAVFGTLAKLLSDRAANFTLALLEELCAAFRIQKCQMTAYHPQCNR